MRTTRTLDPDVAAKAKPGGIRLRKPFKEVINAALRVGLDEILAPPAAKPYVTKARPSGSARDSATTTSPSSDAHLAALAVEYNCMLHSTVADVSRFHGLKWRNPMAS